MVSHRQEKGFIISVIDAGWGACEAEGLPAAGAAKHHAPDSKVFLRALSPACHASLARTCSWSLTETFRCRQTYNWVVREQLCESEKGSSGGSCVHQTIGSQLSAISFQQDKN